MQNLQYDTQCQNDIIKLCTVYSVVQKSQKILKMICTMKKILNKMGFNKIPQGLQILGLGILAILFNWKKIAFYIFVTACFFLMLAEQGILAALAVIPIAYVLDKLGKLF